MTVAQVLRENAVAWWAERLQRYICGRCKQTDRYRFERFQPVGTSDVDLLARDCGKTHCDACGAQIAGQTEEK